MKGTLIRLLNWLLNLLDEQGATPAASAKKPKTETESQLSSDRQEFFRLFELQVRMFEIRADKFTRLCTVLVIVSVIILLAVLMLAGGAASLIPKLAGFPVLAL